MHTPTVQNWKIQLKWRENQKSYCLFFDGASKNNPGKAGVGGIIIDPWGKAMVSYEWGLGETTNNKAEAYNLLMGSRIIKKRAIKDPLIMGDSTVIIEAMASKKSPSNSAMNRIYKRIRKNLDNAGKVTFKHILREHNKIVDKYANKATNRSEGDIRENKELYYKSIP